MKRPNIILLTIDEHTYDAVSYLGNRFVKTPNIDLLYENGVAFDRAYSANPVCAPARGCWATGMYSTEIGLPFNGGFLHEDIPDIGQLMRENGYYAAHSGKWHVDGRNARDSFDCLFYGRDEIPAGGAEIFDEATTNGAVSFLMDYDGDSPFYLQVGYINPHDICEYLHNYEFRTVPSVGLGNEELPPLPVNFNALPDETRLQQVFRRDGDCLIHDDIRSALENWTDEDWRRYIRNYYRYVEKADNEIGRLLTALQNSKHRDDTVIVFTADHGESLARHRMFQKFTLYEESVHVQCIAADFSGRYVKRRKETCHAFVSGIDIFKTVCGLADIPNSRGGINIMRYVNGNENTERDFVYIENNYWGRAVIGGRYKLVVDYIPNKPEDFVPPRFSTHKTGDIQLFDINADPWELNNIASENPDAVFEMLEKLKQTEKRLSSRAMTNVRAQNVIKSWGKRLLNKYEQQKEEAR